MQYDGVLNGKQPFLLNRLQSVCILGDKSGFVMPHDAEPCGSIRR